MAYPSISPDGKSTIFHIRVSYEQLELIQAAAGDEKPSTFARKLLIERVEEVLAKTKSPQVARTT